MRRCAERQQVVVHFIDIIHLPTTFHPALAGMLVAAFYRLHAKLIPAYFEPHIKRLVKIRFGAKSLCIPLLPSF